MFLCHQYVKPVATSNWGVQLAQACAFQPAGSCFIDSFSQRSKKASKSFARHWEGSMAGTVRAPGMVEKPTALPTSDTSRGLEEKRLRLYQEEMLKEMLLRLSHKHPRPTSQDYARIMPVSNSLCCQEHHSECSFLINALAAMQVVAATTVGRSLYYTRRCYLSTMACVQVTL